MIFLTIFTIFAANFIILSKLSTISLIKNGFIHYVVITLVITLEAATAIPMLATNSVLFFVGLVDWEDEYWKLG